MKSFLTLLAVTTALTLPFFTAPRAAMAGQVTLNTSMRNYGGNGAFLAYYLTDAQGKYAGSVWMAGGKARYYEHLTGWYRATGGDTRQIDGITGASVGSGRTLKVSLDLADTLFDAGYKLHIDAAAEDMRESPNEIVVPLTTAGSGQKTKGTRYIADFSYTR
ncbi:DUF2271 domain-containing protein [Allorhizobium terrae]|uniref:DUF2271 domain-containing protein n=1 Tax=Allorhizobium terrae TaxID=1848972 RepID=A0A4S3ZVI2_9HYPH|nr:DUF2271 domain-containing protein [Allorhizobium terrae]THF49741.1 DUF2271 domain-containing protein [Allorhizobium terrae]